MPMTRLTPQAASRKRCRAPRRSSAAGRLACLAGLASLMALAGAAQASRGPATPAHAAAATPAAPDSVSWWLGFHDPTLDALQRSARQAAQGFAVDGQALSARVATLYVMQRWLDGRLAVASGLRQLLARQRQWAALQGPTAEAAQALVALDRQDAALQQRMAQGAEQADRVLAELQQLGALPVSPEAQLPTGPHTPWAVPRFEPGRREAGVKAWAGAQPGTEALAPLAWRVQRLEGASQDLQARLDAALKALAAGQAAEREVLQINQALLLQTDQMLEQQAALAMGWVRLLSGR